MSLSKQPSQSELLASPSELLCLENEVAIDSIEKIKDIRDTRDMSHLKSQSVSQNDSQTPANTSHIASHETMSDDKLCDIMRINYGGKTVLDLDDIERSFCSRLKDDPLRVAKVIMVMRNAGCSCGISHRTACNFLYRYLDSRADIKIGEKHLVSLGRKFEKTQRPVVPIMAGLMIPIMEAVIPVEALEVKRQALTFEEIEFVAFRMTRLIIIERVKRQDECYEHKIPRSYLLSMKDGCETRCKRTLNKDKLGAILKILERYLFIERSNWGRGRARRYGLAHNNPYSLFDVVGWKESVR